MLRRCSWSLASVTSTAACMCSPVPVRWSVRWHMDRSPGQVPPSWPTSSVVRGLSFRGPRDLAAHAGFVGMLGAWPIVKVGACARPVFGRFICRLYAVWRCYTVAAVTKMVVRVNWVHLSTRLLVASIFVLVGEAGPRVVNPLIGGLLHYNELAACFVSLHSIGGGTHSLAWLADPPPWFSLQRGLAWACSYTYLPGMDSNTAALGFIVSRHRLWDEHQS